MPKCKSKPGSWKLEASNYSRGVSLIDAVVGTALMLLVFLGIVGVFQLSIDVITNNRARAGAIALLNERMEYLRSLGYDQIGVIGGIPAGNVPQEEEVTLGDIEYERRTMVFYSDDPADGLGDDDENDIIADYKTIRVEVYWQSRQGERSLELVGRVSPNGVETAVPGGTLTINVLDESAEVVANAEVTIANTGTSPGINIRTYTNVDGQVSFIGAPAATEYQIVVTKPGYSTAQTYPVTAENPNPNPRHLTVTSGQTTSENFVIDLVSTKTVETYMQVREGEWSDSLDNDLDLSTQSGTAISGGALVLEGSPGSYSALGTAQSVEIAPEYLQEWISFAADFSVSASTTAEFKFYDSSGTTLIPDEELPGNSAGFSAASVDLSGISTTTYPSLRIGTTLSSVDPAFTPSVEEYSISYLYGPVPLPDLSFSMQGLKTIGNNPTVYKYDETHTSGGTASITLEEMEADTYQIRVAAESGYALVESCEPQPQLLAPNSTQVTRLYVLPATAHSLLVDVRTDEGALLSDATVDLTAVGFDETLQSGACGQAYFDDLSNVAYTVTVDLSGYQPYTTSVTVSGASALSVVLQSQ